LHQIRRSKNRLSQAIWTVAIKMLLIGCHKRLKRLSQIFETFRSIVFHRLEHQPIFCVPQVISFFGVEIKIWPKKKRKKWKVEPRDSHNPHIKTFFFLFGIFVFSWLGSTIFYKYFCLDLLRTFCVPIFPPIFENFLKKRYLDKKLHEKSLCKGITKLLDHYVESLFLSGKPISREEYKKSISF
jgi:hypothetical protein